MQTQILWFLIYFVLTEGFGMRMNSWGGLGTANLGWFGALQFLVAIISICAIVPGVSYLFRNRKSGIGSAVFGVGLLPLYLIIITIGRGAFGFDVELGYMVKSLLQLKFFLLIYLFSYLISRRNGFENSLQVMAAYALVTAVFIIIIITFHLDTAVSTISTSTDATRFFRAIFPGAFLVALGWLWFFSRFLILGGTGNIIASLICLGATVAQMHRSTLLAVTASVLMVGYQLLISGRITTGKRKWALAGIFGVIAIGAGFYFSSSSSVIVDYFLASFKEMRNISGNSGFRALIISNSWDYIFKDTFGLGVGLDWDRAFDFERYLRTAFFAGPSFDSSYANIVIVFGVPGIALFSWLLFQVAGLSRSRLKTHGEPIEQIFVLFLKLFMIFSLIMGLGADIVLLTSASSTFSLVLVAAVRLQELQNKRIFST